MNYPYVPQYREQASRVMTVTGTASLSVEPNVVQIQLEVATENDELRVAQQENATLTNQVIESLLNVGVSREDIQTSAYNVRPNYDYIDGKQVFRGYEVTHALTVTIKDIDQAGTVIDTAVQSGVNRVSGIQFTVEDREVYYQQALSAALENALAKAVTLAETMQLNLDPSPIKIVEEKMEPPVTYKTVAAVSTENFTTPIEPGQIVIRARVETKFQFYA